MAALGVANGRFGFSDLVSGNGQCLLERLTGGRLLIESGHEFCISLGRSLSGSKAFSRCALFGSLQSGMGISQLPFEHLAGSSPLAKRCLLLRKPVGGRRRVGEVRLSSSVERSRDLLQLPAHCLPSRGGFCYPGLMPCLLLVTLRGRCRHCHSMSSLDLLQSRVRTRDFVAGCQKISSERVVLCDFLTQDRFELGLSLSSQLDRGRSIIGRPADRFAERALGVRQLPLE